MYYLTLWVKSQIKIAYSSLFLVQHSSFTASNIHHFPPNNLWKKLEIDESPVLELHFESILL